MAPVTERTLQVNGTSAQTGGIWQPGQIHMTALDTARRRCHGRIMREKELRLALVCYGGISLAVYMHGITKEIWRLARASQAFHDDDQAIGATAASAMSRTSIAARPISGMRGPQRA